MNDLNAIFSRGLGQLVRPPALYTQWLNVFLEQGHHTYPEVDVVDAILVYELGVRASKHAQTHYYEWLQSIEPLDMFLAIACEQEDAGAYHVIEARYGKNLRHLLSRYAKGRLTVEDLYQTLWERIFVATSTRAASIADYSGRGLLKNWLRVTAVRMAIDHTRQSKRSREVLTIEGDTFLEFADDSMDLELDFLINKYKSDFKVAFERAIDCLEHDDRNLLRQHLIGGLSIDQIGALHNIHRATAARRLERMRQRLLQETRRELTTLLSINNAEFESIMALIASKLEVSFERILHLSERQS